MGTAIGPHCCRADETFSQEMRDVLRVGPQVLGGLADRDDKTLGAILRRPGLVRLGQLAQQHGHFRRQPGEVAGGSRSLAPFANFQEKKQQ
jgi:hypothetical protein